MCASKGAGVLVMSVTQFSSIKSRAQTKTYCSREPLQDVWGIRKKIWFMWSIKCPVAKRFWAEFIKFSGVRVALPNLHPALGRCMCSRQRCVRVLWLPWWCVALNSVVGKEYTTPWPKSVGTGCNGAIYIVSATGHGISEIADQAAEGTHRIGAELSR